MHHHDDLLSMTCMHVYHFASFVTLCSFAVVRLSSFSSFCLLQYKEYHILPSHDQTKRNQRSLLCFASLFPSHLCDQRSSSSPVSTSLLLPLLIASLHLNTWLTVSRMLFQKKSWVKDKLNWLSWSGVFYFAFIDCISHLLTMVMEVTRLMPLINERVYYPESVRQTLKRRDKKMCLQMSLLWPKKTLYSHPHVYLP